MCGIIGYVGDRPALPLLLDGLRRLEYRGYDSAGVVINRENELVSAKSVGRIAALEASLGTAPLHGRAGLGHTRWATHGGVSASNAHPHFSCDGRLAVVHNGIVENHAELRRELGRHRFRSGTDTEVIPHLIEECLEQCGNDLAKATQRALSRIRGSFALGVLSADDPGHLVAARVDCPLVIGLGDGEHFLASDVAALLPHTRRVLHLEEHDVARVGARQSRVYGPGLMPRRRRPQDVGWSDVPAEKGRFATFMQKEIHEQVKTLAAELSEGAGTLAELHVPDRIDRVVMAACGTAWHAALVGKAALEEFAGIPVEAALASELRYGDSPLNARTLLIAVSQSGETADTLAAARRAREAGARVLALTNGRGSTLAREADAAVLMQAGPEMGVAATKTYTSQVLRLILLSLELGRRRGSVPASRRAQLLQAARRLPEQAARILAQETSIAEIARRYARGFDFMFLGRHYNLPTALEGALKMKEITYLHAEGYGAGEMKHGPLALVDERMVCVAAAPRTRVLEKLASNIQEVRARRGVVLSVVSEGDVQVRAVSDQVIEIPLCEEVYSPILAAIPLQLLAYHAAVELGRDVDRPRNLAKSVTVE